jgi:hypothetical protein
MSSTAGTERVRRSASDKRALGAAVKAATLAEWQARRELLVTLPSGVRVKIRPINIERQALAGGLPRGLRRLAAQSRGSAGLNAVLDRVLLDEDGDGDGQLDELIGEQRIYLDNLLRQMVVEPELPDGVDLDQIILPVDYHYLLRIAQREIDYDAEGRYLWGAEPLSRWDTFRTEHSCAEDCEGCSRVRATFSAALG